MAEVLVGITGNIAAGKSHVLDTFRDCGMTIIDADKVGHQIYATRPKVVDEVVAYFGEDVRHADSNVGIDRSVLRGYVFGQTQQHKENLKTLTEMVTPHIRKEILKQARTYEGIVGIEAAIMYESGWNRSMDTVVLIYCDDDVRANRLSSRDGISVDEAKAKIESVNQIAQHDKLQLTINNGGYVVNNSGSLDQTKSQSKSVYQQLKKL